MRSSQWQDRRPSGPATAPVDTRPLARSLTRAVAGVLAAAALATGAAACGGKAGGAKQAPAPSAGTAGTATTGAATGDRDASARNAVRLEEMFAGRFPGVQVYQQSGGVVIRVRGANTINGSAEPLFVLDGQPLVQGNGGVIDVNPNDIARIEVLKSAGELAMYGSRGANGVVRITTKRGGPRGDA
jgi:TonB-dependent SusC/RagA subfamily outer membrane receptor